VGGLSISWFIGDESPWSIFKKSVDKVSLRDFSSSDKTHLVFSPQKPLLNLLGR
jgi:hypothetical protein